MAQRITRAMLEAKLATVAKLTRTPLRLSGAYGGWEVQEVINEMGGIRSLTHGHYPARHVATFLDGMLAALWMEIPEGEVARRLR